MSTTSLAPGVLDEFAAIVGRHHVLVDADQRAGYERDWTGRFRGATPAVVRPGTVDEVVAIVDRCAREGIAVVPQGGNTGLVGGGVPLEGELVVSLRRLGDRGPVDLDASQVTVGAGVTIGQLRAHAAAVGLAYAVDLAARDSATVGGSVATNAGGLHHLRWGGTRQQLLGVEAVLANGEVVRHLGGLAKDNTGYDLAGLLCGSEGTLGVVTAARVRLIPALGSTVVALVGFPGVDEAVTAVGRWRRGLDCLDAAELFLDSGVELVCEVRRLPRPFPTRCGAYVLLEASSDDDPTERLAALVHDEPVATDVAVATDPRRAAQLWAYREEHTAAINTLGVPHKLDVTLPFGRLAEFMAEVPRRVASVRPDASTWLFGHVGDGNIHVNVTGGLGDRQPPSVTAAVDEIDDAVLTYVADLGGSISAEHGVGRAKRRWLHLNRSDAELAAFRSIKSALDPQGLLNPNVLLP